MRRRDHEYLMGVQEATIADQHTMIQDLLERLSTQERFYVDRIRELEDAQRATSLDQLRGMHPTAAMELQPPEPERKWFIHDATGLVSTEVDPRDHEVTS